MVRELFSLCGTEKNEVSVEAIQIGLKCWERGKQTHLNKTNNLQTIPHAVAHVCAPTFPNASLKTER